jgi:hypothetical protein
MYTRLCLVIALILSSAVIAIGQQPATTPPKEFKSGELISIEGDLRLRVLPAKTSAFADVAIEGTQVAITLEFSDPVQKHSDAHYLIISFNRDKPDASHVALGVGTERLIPVAYLDGFPDPTGQMPEIKDRKASAKLRSAVMMKTIVDSTPDKPFITFLFDVPAASSQAQKKLFLSLGAQQVIVSLQK